MKFNFRLFFQQVYLTLFKSKENGVPLRLKQVLFLAWALLVGLPVFWLTAYLGWVLDKLLFPGFEKIKVKQPIFIIGNPRSGTTFLHRLMAKDSQNFSSLRVWEMLFAPTITQRRIFQTLGLIDQKLGSPLRRIIDFIDQHTFATNFRHHSGLREFEEDDLILLYVWSSSFIMALFPYPETVMPRLLRFDQLPSERQRVMPFYKACVKRHLYSHQAANKHFLSKNPVFSSRIDGLRQTFPSAKFIYLVRNPLQVIASMLSFALGVWHEALGFDKPFPFTEYILEAAKTWYEYTLAYLDNLPKKDYLIVKFDDLVREPERVVERIYRHFGFSLSPKFTKILKQVNHRSARHRSKHKYSLKKLGLSKNKLLAEYSGLFQRFSFQTSI